VCWSLIQVRCKNITAPFQYKIVRHATRTVQRDLLESCFGVRNCDELASNFSCKLIFWYKFLERVHRHWSKHLKVCSNFTLEILMGPQTRASNTPMCTNVKFSMRLIKHDWQCYQHFQNEFCWWWGANRTFTLQQNSEWSYPSSAVWRRQLPVVINCTAVVLSRCT